jgi:hypothetical protein
MPVNVNYHIMRNNTFFQWHRQKKATTNGEFFTMTGKGSIENARKPTIVGNPTENHYRKY